MTTSMLLFNMAVFLGVVIETATYIYLAQKHRMNIERAWIAVKVGQGIACAFLAVLMITTLAGHNWPPEIHYISLGMLGVALLGAISTSLSRLSMDIHKSNKRKPEEPLSDKVLGLLNPVTLEADRGNGPHHNDRAG